MKKMLVLFGLLLLASASDANAVLNRIGEHCVTTKSEPVGVMTVAHNRVCTTRGRVTDQEHEEGVQVICESVIAGDDYTYVFYCSYDNWNRVRQIANREMMERIEKAN